MIEAILYERFGVQWGKFLGSEKAPVSHNDCIYVPDRALVFVKFDDDRGVQGFDDRAGVGRYLKEAWEARHAILTGRTEATYQELLRDDAVCLSRIRAVPLENKEFNDLVLLDDELRKQQYRLNDLAITILCKQPMHHGAQAVVP